MSDASRTLPEYMRSYGYTVYTESGTQIAEVKGVWPGINGQRVDDEEPVKIDAQTVADYVALQHADSTPDDMGESLEGLKLVPPFPFLVFHYDRPEVDPAALDDFKGKVGVFITSLTLPEVEDSGLRGMILLKYPDAHWLMSISVVAHANGHMPTLIPYNPAIILDKEGRLLTVAGDMMCETPPGSTREMWRSNALIETFTALHACAFMHVRHSDIVEVPPSRAAVRKAARKRKTLHRHHKLVVKPLETHMARVRQVRLVPGSKKALHMVRGHFATYTEDAPLLGKFIGTVWRAPHWRGLEDEGVVTKDYELGS